MRSTYRSLVLTMAVLATATLCWAQDPGATSEAPKPSPTPSAQSTPAVADSTPVEALPAIPAAPTESAPAPVPDAAPAPPVADISAPAPAPVVEAKPVAPPPAHKEKAARVREPRKVAPPAESDTQAKDKVAATAAAAAASTEPPASLPPPPDGSGDPSTAATASNPAPPAPAPVVSKPLAAEATDAEQPAKRGIPWIPLAVFVLGAAGVITMVARRRRVNSISIV